MKAVIFDLDGLMVDSEPLHRQAFNDVLAEFGVHIEMPEWKEVIGGTVESASEIFIKNHNIPLEVAELAQRKDARYKAILHQIKPKKGLIGLLGKLETWIGLASQASRAKLMAILGILGITEKFDAVVSQEEAGNPKPAPDVYLAAAKKLGVNPGECLALEDTETGLRSAKAAGMRCYAIPSPEAEGQDFSAADRILGSLDEVYDAMIEDQYLGS